MLGRQGQLAPGCHAPLNLYIGNTYIDVASASASTTGKGFIASRHQRASGDQLVISAARLLADEGRMLGQLQPLRLPDHEYPRRRVKCSAGLITPLFKFTNKIQKIGVFKAFRDA